AIEYFIVGGDGTFWINPTTGELFLGRALNREAVSHYSLTISAVNDKAAIVLATNQTFDITVTNANNHPPVFTVGSIAMSLWQNSSIGTVFYMVHAVTKNEGLASVIQYS